MAAAGVFTSYTYISSSYVTEKFPWHIFMSATRRNVTYNSWKRGFLILSSAMSRNRIVNENKSYSGRTEISRKIELKIVIDVPKGKFTSSREQVLTGNYHLVVASKDQKRLFTWNRTRANNSNRKPAILALPVQSSGKYRSFRKLKPKFLVEWIAPIMTKHTEKTQTREGTIRRERKKKFVIILFWHLSEFDEDKQQIVIFV